MLALTACLLAAPPREQGVTGSLGGGGNKVPDYDPTDPHARDWYPHGQVHEFCKGNIIDRGLTVCCQAKCGQCGGGGCANAPGGAKECCHEDIMHGRGDNYCLTEDQFSCVMPMTCEKDQCLPMCPLHPGCSIIWNRRGLDYEEVRKLNVRTLNVYAGVAVATHKNSSDPA